MKMIIVDNLVVKNGRKLRVQLFSFTIRIPYWEIHASISSGKRDQLNFLKKFNCEITEMDDNTSFFPLVAFLDLHLQGKSIKDFREYLFYYQYYCEEISNVSFSLSVGGPKFFIESVLFCLPLISADIFLVASFK